MILFGLLLLLPFAAADFMEDLQSQQQSLVGQKLPGPAGVLFKNERINLHVTLSDGNELVFGIVTEKKIVKQFQMSVIDNPTVNVYTTEETIKKIESSENPLDAFKEALDDKKVTYEAIGFGKKMKFGITKFFVKIASWFT
jgi:hypothetical protein